MNFELQKRTTCTKKGLKSTASTERNESMSADPKSHGNTEVVELLRRTRDLLAGPTKNGENLAKVEEAHSFTAGGIPCEAWDELAGRWSITGALAKFAMAPLPWSKTPLPGVRTEVLFDSAFRYLFAAAILENPQTVNGVNNRGWDAVRDLIEFAILLAEHEVQVLPMLALPPGKTLSPELRERLERIVKVRGATSVQVPS
jgi:hypothetical protein